MKIRLDQLLVDRKLTGSKTKAQALIMSGQVFVEGIKRDKPGWQTGSGVEISVKKGLEYVSRGGLKIASANHKFKIDFKDKIVLDVGSSTGGFTDYALQNGAKLVYAVDVGTNQLDFKLRSNPQVVVMEKTDIRKVGTLPDLADIAVIDVSFISMRAVLPSVAQLIKPKSAIIAMVKPQFEAGVKEASKNKGVIKNDTIRRSILKEFELWAKNHFVVVDKADSEVAGAKGNVERFYLLNLPTGKR